MIKRLRTYIDGFDDRIGGGIPTGSLVLLAGEPGSMKSSVAFNILYNNALADAVPGTYITLEQSRESLLVHLQGLGMDLDAVSEQLSIIDMALIRKTTNDDPEQDWLELLKMYIRNLKDNMGFSTMVLDSLPILVMMASMRDPRKELFHFFEWLRALDATVFVITEMPAGSQVYGAYSEDFLCDGIFHLVMDRVDQITVQRRIRCVKMRATRHDTNFYTLMFEGGTFQVTQALTDSY